MNPQPGQLLVLDTSVIVHLARQDATGQKLEDAYSLSTRHERPLYSTVTEGELYAFATYRGWGSQKLDKLRDILHELVRVESSHPEIIEAYAQLYVADRNGGHSTKQNDLWIAATAIGAGAALMTLDKDFDWMHPDHLQVFRPENVR